MVRQRPVGALGDTLLEDMAQSLGSINRPRKSAPTIDEELQTDELGNMPKSPFAEKATSEADDAKAAQESRSKKYGISIKEKTNVTKPSEYKDVPDSDFLDPVNYRYPCPNKEQTQAAARYWGQEKNRTQYSDSEQAVISKRLEAKKKEFDVAQDEESKGIISGTPGQHLVVAKGADDKLTLELLDEVPEDRKNDVYGQISTEIDPETKSYMMSGRSTELGDSEYIILNPTITESDEEAKSFTLLFDGVAKKEAQTPETDPTEPVKQKLEIPEVYKSISVASNLYDEPVQWQFYDLFDAFMSACYKLSVAAEVTESPMTPQFFALIDELAVLLKKTVVAVNQADTDDGDGTADDFSGDDDDDGTSTMMSMSLSMEPEIRKTLATKLVAAMAKRAPNKEAIEKVETLIKAQGNQDAELTEKVAELKKQVETTTATVTQLSTEVQAKQATVAQLEQKHETVEKSVTENEDKLKSLEESLAKLNDEYAAKSAEYEKLLASPVPTPDQNRRNVDIEQIVDVASKKSVVTMNNRDFLSDSIF